MPVRSFLIAEPNHGTIENLSCTISDHLQNIAIDTCTSAEEICHKFESLSYDAIALNPLFLPVYRSIRRTKDQLLAPLLVTVGQRDLMVAEAALNGDVFGLIAKPVVPREATHIVRLALWQNQLLKLLASNERAFARFKQHMETFPDDLKTQAQFVKNGDAGDRTFQALKSSMRLLLNVEDEQALFDLAVLVEQRARQRALDSLLRFL